MKMSVHTFVKTYFLNWKIAEISTYGTEHGYIKLHEGETFIKIYFILRGASHWTDDRCLVDSIVGCSRDSYMF